MEPIWLIFLMISVPIIIFMLVLGLFSLVKFTIKQQNEQSDPVRRPDPEKGVFE
jgi:heme/copper-type cytochrome/quinol oxidase subunit 2